MSRFAKLFKDRCKQLYPGRKNFSNVSISVYLGQIALLKDATPEWVTKNLGGDLGKANLYHSGLVFVCSCDVPDPKIVDLTRVITTLELWDMDADLYSSLIPTFDNQGNLILKASGLGRAQILFQEPPDNDCDFWKGRWDSLQYVGKTPLGSLVGETGLYKRAQIYNFVNPNYGLFQVTNKTCNDVSCPANTRVWSKDNSCDTFVMAMINELTYLDPEAFPNDIWKHLWFNSFQIAVGAKSNMQIIKDPDQQLMEDIRQYTENIKKLLGAFNPQSQLISLVQLPVTRDPKSTETYELLVNFISNPELLKSLTDGTSLSGKVLFVYVIQDGEWQLAKLNVKDLLVTFGPGPGIMYSSRKSLCPEGNCPEWLRNKNCVS